MPWDHTRRIAGATLLLSGATVLRAQPARADSLAAAAARALVADLRLGAPGVGGARVCVTVPPDTSRDGPHGARRAFAAALRSALAGLGPSDPERAVEAQLDSVVAVADSGRVYVTYTASVRRLGGSWGLEERVYTFRSAGPDWAAPRRISLYFADGQISMLEAHAPACVGG